MDESALLAALVGSALTLIASAVFWRRMTAKQSQSADEQRHRAQELEKQLHLKERDFLAERNGLEIAHAESVRAARAAAFEEGRSLGRTEGNADHINELTAQRMSLMAKFEADRDKALTDAQDKLRAEYELQTKLFSVKISPYVSVREEGGLIRKSFQTSAGYQYQLLVNGIPAFAPHVVSEHTEVRKEVNPEVERMLLRTAERAANAAIDLYLGGSTQFARLTEPILKRLPKT
jgi:hypothetical protein